MDTFKTILLVVISLLLLIQIVDRSREPEQMGELKASLDQARADFQKLRAGQDALVRQNTELAEANRQLAIALDAFRKGFDQGFAIGVRSEGGSTNSNQQAVDQTPTQEPATAPTGKPVLGRNFLLPYDRSPFDPEQLGGELKAFAQDPTDGLNDILTSMGATSSIVDMVTDKLCTQRPEQPELWHQGLATSVIIENDFTRFTFTLRDGVRWHIPPLAYQPGYEWLQDEVDLTAEDFVFYLEMVNHPEVVSPHLKTYYEGATATAVDDHTLVVEWEKSEYTNIAFTLGLSPFPKHIYSRDEHGQELAAMDIPIAFNEHWFDQAFGLVGTGPYVLEDYTPKKQVRFRRNPAYWGITDHAETVHWDLSTQAPEPQLLAFKNGQVHYNGLRPNQYKAEILDGHESRFAAPDPDDPTAGWEGPFGWQIISSNRWYGICWNTKRSTLADPRVRQALAHAYDFDRIASEVFFGLAERSTGPVHPSSPYFNHQTQAFRFDLQQAAALLDEAGWVDSDGDGWRDKMIDGTRTPLSLDITYYALARTWANLVSLYAEDCKRIGVQIVPSPVEDTEWARRADNRDFDGFMIVWSSGLEVDFKQLWHSDGADEPQSSNYAGFANAEADVGIEALRNTFDLDRRYEIAAEVADIIYREQPYLFISVGKSVFAWQNERYEGVADDRELLEGVTYGFENYHPLQTTESSRWYLSRD